MSVDRRASFYHTGLAFLAITGLSLVGCSSETKPNTNGTQKDACPSTIGGESTSLIFPDNSRRALAWDIIRDGGYQWLLGPDCKTSFAIKQEQDTITLRLKRSDYPFAEAFNQESPLVYMFDYDFEIYRNVRIDFIDRIVDTMFRSAGVFTELDLNGRPSLMVTNDVTADNDYVYVKFPNVPENDNFWVPIFRKPLFTGVESPGITFGGLLHFTKRAKV